MSKKKRWGSPYQDNRDWKIYNENLVKRGEFYLSLDFVRTMDCRPMYHFHEIPEKSAKAPFFPFFYRL